MYNFDTDNLDGCWDFKFLGDIEPDNLCASEIDFDEFMIVPGCFDSMVKYAGQRGLAAYRRQIELPGDSAFRLYIDGAHHWCRIYLDGELLGEHIGGFTQFYVDISAGEASGGELLILIDNRIDFDRCPLHLEYFDWYHFGGISRGVRLRRLPAVHIDQVRAVTQDWRAGRLEITLQYDAKATANLPLTVEFDGKCMLSETADIDSGGGVLTYLLELPEAELWSPASPVLHELRISLGKDRWRGDIGLRQISVEDGAIKLNGEPLQLRGFCRHEAHPQFGHTQPHGLILSDLQQLTAMDVNFIRGSHYPQDEAFMAMCDKLGIMLWCETVGWQHSDEHLANSHFIHAQCRNAAEMVQAAANHPSVIMWGALNESYSHDPKARGGYEKILGLLRELDPSRPITYASNHPMEDICLDLADIISVNTYPGWYSGEIDGIGERLDAISAHMASDPASSGKPLIISEIGAGAIYGWRDRHAARWSEQYQCDLLKETINHIFSNPDKFVGVALWQFCDIRTAEPAYKSLGRPRAFNNKGVVDEYRREKMAFDTVAKLFKHYSR